ncbi:MAG: hypothetical protein VB078_00470 [Clostridiaceae bacterium]|nr:hypothetical protein [Clostridiaceae bacterium]
MAVNPYAAELYCNMIASFRLADTTAAADATVTATGYDTDISQLSQTHDGIETMSAKWATLENGGWPLDGTCDIMPDSLTGVQTGFWSNLSDADGNLSGVALTYTFAANHSSYGFTMAFDDKTNWYPKSITVAAYNSTNTLLDSKTFDCASPQQAVIMPVTNYRKVIVTFSSTQLPYQRVHLSACIFGVVEAPGLMKASILYETDPRMKALPTGELSITIDNTDGKYNQRSPNSLYAYLQEGQPFDNLKIGLGPSRAGIEYTDMGKQFYFTKSAAKDSSMTADITANDMIYKMGKTTYRKGINGTDTVSNLVSAVLLDSGTGLTANIPTAIGARVIGSNIPLVTHREAIRLIAQAARCSAFINRAGELELAEIAAGTPSDTLDGSNMLDWPDIQVDDAVNTVNVTVYSYYRKLAVDDVSMYEGTATISGTQTIWIEYSSSATSPSTTVTGGTLVSTVYYYYGAYLTITASGEVTIKITGADELTSSHYEYSANNITGSEAAQTLKIDNALIVSTDIASAVATYQLGLSRVTYPVTEMGNPSRELIDTATITDAYGGTGNAVITKQKYSYDGGLKCELEAVE